MPRHPSFRLWCLSLATGLGLAGAAQAQSLQELYEAARGFDASYLAARAQAESAQWRTEQAYALRRPSASLTGSATRNETDPPPSLTNPSGDRFGSNNTNLAVAGRQPLFNRANGATIEQAERALEVARAELDTAEQDLIVRVSQAYFDVLAAQDSLATARAGKTAISEQLASAKRNFEVGTATITDTREAQARFDLSTAQELAAENELRNRRVALDTVVGRVAVAPKPLAVPVSLPTLPTAVDPLLGAADAIHPLIRRARLGVEIAELETAKARAGHLPTVDLVANVSTAHASAGQLPGTTSAAALGVQMNLPLFAGYAVQNRIKETLSLEERARNDLNFARRTVTLNTRQAFNGLQSGEAQVRALEAAEASSKLALEATQLGYRVGVRVNLDVLNAQTQLFQTQRDLARARYDVLLGTLRLRQAAGQLRPEDVNAVNALLAR